MWNIEDIEPSITFKELVFAYIHIFNKMNTQNITDKDIENGNKKEIVILIPKDIPSQTNSLSEYRVLFLMVNLDSHTCCIVIKRII